MTGLVLLLLVVAVAHLAVLVVREIAWHLHERAEHEAVLASLAARGLTPGPVPGQRRGPVRPATAREIAAHHLDRAALVNLDAIEGQR